MISGENRHFTLIRCADDEEWREERAKGIGASDMGAILGLSKYRSPYEVWLEKTGRVSGDDISGKPAVAFGNDFEEIAGRNFQKAHPGSKVRRVNAMCQSIERPYVRASLDFEAKLPGKDGWGVLEVKTTRNRDLFEESLLDGYTAQVVQQLYVTGRKWGVIWCFFRDTCEYGSYPVEPDGEDLKAVTDAADAFWEFVERDEPPEMTGLPSEGAALAGQHPDASDEWLRPDDPDGSIDAMVRELESVSASEKGLEAEKRRIQDELKSLIGDGKGVLTATRNVMWVRGKSRRFDRKAFERDHPDLAAQYMVEAPRDMGLRIHAND